MLCSAITNIHVSMSFRFVRIRAFLLFLLSSRPPSIPSPPPNNNNENGSLLIAQCVFFSFAWQCRFTHAPFCGRSGSPAIPARIFTCNVARTRDAHGSEASRAVVMCCYVSLVESIAADKVCITQGLGPSPSPSPSPPPPPSPQEMGVTLILQASRVDQLFVCC